MVPVEMLAAMPVVAQVETQVEMPVVVVVMRGGGGWWWW